MQESLQAGNLSSCVKAVLAAGAPLPWTQVLLPPASLTFQVDLIQTDLTPLPTPTAHAFGGGGSLDLTSGSLLCTCRVSPHLARILLGAPRPAGLLSSLKKSPEGVGAQVGGTGRGASIQEPPGKWPLTAERFKAQAAASPS